MTKYGDARFAADNEKWRFFWGPSVSYFGLQRVWIVKYLIFVISKHHNLGPEVAHLATLPFTDTIYSIIKINVLIVHRCFWSWVAATWVCDATLRHYVMAGVLLRTKGSACRVWKLFGLSGPCTTYTKSQINQIEDYDQAFISVVTASIPQPPFPVWKWLHHRNESHPLLLFENRDIWIVSPFNAIDSFTVLWEMNFLSLMVH